MKLTHLPFACLCNNDLQAQIEANSPKSTTCLFSINGDFLDYGAKFEIHLDQWFGISAINDRHEFGYFMQADDPDLGWRQMWRILVALEGVEKFKERTEYIIRGLDEFDFTAGIDLSLIKEK